MAKLQCKAPLALDEIIEHARIERECSKQRVLMDFVIAAINDPADFSVEGRYPGHEEVNCTLMDDEGQFFAAKHYRHKYHLPQKKKFFLFALRHGATLYEAALQARAQQSPALPSESDTPSRVHVVR